MNERPRRSSISSVLRIAGGQGTASASGMIRRHRPDYWLLTLTALLLVVGLVVVYSISPGLAASQNISQGYFITKQLIDVGLGVVAFGLAAYLPIKVWYKIATPIVMAAAVGSLVVMLTPLDTIYQAHRWIRVGSFSIQVAELIKLALVVWLARFLTLQWQRGRITDFKNTLQPLLAILLIIGVVVAKLQSDLGSAAVMIAIISFMAFTIGIPLKKIALFAAMIVAFLVIAISSSGYRRQRLSTYLHPQSNCQGTGYHACQALISVGSGGLFGLGLGYSVQAYGYLPEASNDSIFAIIGEKFGFVGSVIMLSVYGLFLFRIKLIVERCADQFSRLLAVGILAWFSTQMIINIGAMLGLLPLKGITLPLISQGGTSLIFLTAALGLVFQISRYTSYSVTQPQNNDQDYTPSSRDRSDGRRVGRPHHPYLIARPRT